MQRGRENRTPSLSPSLVDSHSPSPRPPYSATKTHSNRVRWSNSISPDDPLRNRGAYMTQEQASSRQRDYFATRPPTPPPPPHQQGDGRDKAKRKPSVSFLKDQIKDKVKGKKSTTAKDDMKKGSNDRSSSSSALKTSLVFLGSVAAATYVANRFWPRGVTYGERERWEEEDPRRQHERRRGRSASRQSRRLRRGSSGDEVIPRVYRDGGRGSERVVYDDDEGPSRRGLSRGRSGNPRYTVVEVVPGRGISRAASTRQEQQCDIENCNHSRSGDRRRLSSSHYHLYHDDGERRYYSPVRRRDEDDDEFEKGRRSTTTIYREPRYVEHQVTTLRRSSSDDPYTTTERVIRRQYRVDERG